MKTVKKNQQLFRSLGIGLAVFLGMIIYAYGFQVTKVNLDETRSPRRQEQLVRILRALAKPDLVKYEQEEFLVSDKIMVPCPVGGFVPETPDKNSPYIVVTPPCAAPGEKVVVEGYNFEPNTKGPLSFIPPSEVTLPLGTLETNEEGYFSLEVKLPKRESAEPQQIRAVTRKNIGAPQLSQTAIDTWDKIVETVFLALLATTLGTLFAVPLSFFAARNLMKDVTSPLISIALNLLLLPVGFWLGIQVASWIGNVSALVGGQWYLNLIGAILCPVLFVFIFRWAMPQEEIELPTTTTRVLRAVVLAGGIFIAIFGLFFFSRFTLFLGDTIAPKLAGFNFIGTFISDLGDILGMLITAIVAIAGAGFVSSLGDRAGKLITRKTSITGSRILTIILSTAAGIVLGLLIMAVVDWFYQFNNPAVTLYWPMGIGGAFGLFLSLRFKPKDSLPVGLVIYYLARTLFNALRSIEALIMVSVFVVWVGIGPFAGVLALSLHTIAALAKLYSEQVESILAGPIEAVSATGANRLQTIVYAVIPQIIPPYISFTMYRWDINVRMSTIIGFAGGGGIGFLLIQNINLLNYRAASAQMLAIALVVASMDYLSSQMRERVI